MDLISRQDAIDALRERVFHSLTDEFYGAMQVLKELPSAQQWIPCSERLPEENEDYLVTAYDGIKHRITIVSFKGHWILTGTRAYWRVIAWTPLPEPWKGAEEC